MKQLVLALAVLLLIPGSALRAAETSKPNIILIFADDLGYGDVGPFGSKINRTPNLDRMAREGLKFTSFYAAPVCTPSRAQVLTGCYAKRVSLPNVIFPACPIGLNPQEHTVAELLKERGYATMCIGKWHVGDQWEFLPTRHGFDHYFGLPYSNDMGGPPPGASAARRRRDKRPPLPLIRDGQVIETVSPAQQDALTERYTEEAVKFIREHREGPFFLYFPHTAVHVPLHPGKKFQGQSTNGRYGDWVEEIDWSVGRVFDALRELKLTKQTLVIYSSDNGPWLTQGANGGVAGPLRGGKGGTYEGGMREPTIAWWPGHVPAGQVCEAIAGNIDFLPTFVSLAGGRVPTDNRIDGKDISPLLLGQTQASPHEAMYYFSGNNLQAVRSGPWKLAIMRQNECRPKSAKAVSPQTPFTPTLYNLDTDIGERTNVIAQHPDVVARLQQLIAKMNTDLGTNKLGPGVRAPGRVTKPVGLWLPGQAPAFGNGEAPALDTLELGDSLGDYDAPDVAKKALTITCEVEPKSSNGVIVAHGGITYGYAVYLRNGQLEFTVRDDGKPVSITANATPASAFKLEARLARDGAMSLAIDGRTVAQGKGPELISRQPVEDFCVGHDNRMAVGDYTPPARFTGTVRNLKITRE